MPKKRSLKWFLIMSIVAATTLPIFLTGTIFTRLMGNLIKEQIISGNKSLSVSFVDQIEDYLKHSLNDLQSLRSMIDRQDFEMIHYNSLLDSFRKNKEYFTKIQILNKIGYTRYVSPYDEAYIGIDMSQSKFFTETIKTGKPYWSPTFISPQSDLPVVSVSIPFENGVITGFLSLEKLTEAAKKIGYGNAINVTITDQTSTYIAHFKDDLVLKREFDPNYDMFRKKYSGEIMSAIMDYNGESMLVTASIIEHTNWAIVFSQPVNRVFEPIRILHLYLIFGAVFIVIVTVFLCMRHITVIMNTINKFSRSASVVTRGNYEHTIEDIKYKEFSELADQFNSMAKAVKVREIELGEKEEKYRSIFTAAKDAILIINSRTTDIIDVNDFASELYGYTKKEFLKFKLEDISGEPRITGEASSHNIAWIPECVHKKKDGTTIIVEISISHHHHAQGSDISTFVVRDITKRIEQEEERRQMETKLRQSQKMEAIGTLSGGIAHDFNNILSGIFGYSQLAENNIHDPEKAKKHIHQVLKGARRAADLVQQILTFSRQKKHQKHPLYIDGLVKEVIKLLRSSIPATIEIKESVVTTLPVMADSTQIHQVILNICTNAYHAMSDTGGILTVDLKQIDLKHQENTTVFSKLPGKYLELSISDTGHGMDEKTIEKAFDPYFTTKDVGKGTGFGLALVKAIVEDHNGFVNVESRVGQGSTFYVYFPVLKDKTTLPLSRKKTPRDIKGTETIMVVDDDENIRLFLKEYLTHCGYTVFSFENGKKALDAFKKDPYAFDLIITDMTMPHMTGEELAVNILQIRKNTPIVLCTGYNENISESKALEIGIKKYINKPVETGVMAALIRELLDA